VAAVNFFTFIVVLRFAVRSRGHNGPFTERIIDDADRKRMREKAGENPPIQTNSID
jgi:hypothetical protein